MKIDSEKTMDFDNAMVVSVAESFQDVPEDVLSQAQKLHTDFQNNVIEISESELEEDSNNGKKPKKTKKTRK